MKEEVEKIIRENTRRNAAIHATFNPITGEGAILERVRFALSDFSLPVQYIPKQMMRIPMVRQLAEAGSIRSFLEDFLQVDFTEEDKEKVVEQFVRLRMRYDFCFWAAFLVMIKNKEPGNPDCHFRLNRPQRRLITMFESMRIEGKPIRVIILKARQWGGSTATQIYMAWLQLVHRVGLNSLIIAQQNTGSENIKDMFDRMMKAYPTKMLHKLGESYTENEAKLVGVGHSGLTQAIPQRNCKISVGSAKSPDSCRGGDYALVHLSEVGLWTVTEGKKPESIVRSACSGILLKPYTMIVYESTANGTGNFFQKEYDAAKMGKSQFKPIFVPWYEADQYTAEVEDVEKFATWLYENRENRNVASEREEPGIYLWTLWEQGATLEALQWYILERSKYNDHGDMASEYPSDDEEAFVHSGARVFDQYKVRKLRKTCRVPKYVGDVYADYDEGENALLNVRFREDSQGQMWVWALPDIDEQETVTDRYLVVVDIGGRSRKADWSVIAVFDRINMIDGGKPSVVAQWYGHIDMDLLAWKSAQIAAYYDNALLVIEKNTLDTHDKERNVEGEQAQFILNQIKDVYENIYARKQSEEDIVEGVPKKYGFHTNVSTKPMIISTLIKVVRENMYTERDVRCCDEYITYEKKQNGAYGAIIGKHDDLLMTRAIGLHICFYEMEVPEIVKRTNPYRYDRRRKPVTAATIG